MRTFFYMLVFICTSSAADAQSSKMIQDKERIFTEAEVLRLDSMLQQYHLQSGNFLLIVTDSLDISTDSYSGHFFREYGIDSNSKKAALALMLSRKNGLVFMAANKHLRPFISQEQLIEMLNAGIPSLKEKRREEAARLICEKAMMLLATIPKN